MAQKLSPRQKRFADEFLVDLNATQAALRSGYSEKTAKSQGHRLLAHPGVAEYIGEAQAARAQRTRIDQDWVLSRLARIADSDIRRLFYGNELCRPADLDDDTASAIASIDVVTVPKGEGEVEHVSKIKLWDKPRALEMIARHLGMFKDRVEHSGPGGGAIPTSLTVAFVRPKPDGHRD